MKWQSYWFYIPIALVLALGWAVGGALAFGVHFLGWFSAVSVPSARLALALFGMGMLGASAYSSRWWAVDLEQAVVDHKLLPHFFDAFGYATTIVGGGVSGVVLWLLATGVGTVATKSDSGASIRPAAAFVMAFCRGLYRFKVEEVLERYVRKIAKGGSK